MFNQQIIVVIADVRPFVNESLTALLMTDSSFAKPAVAITPTDTLAKVKLLHPDLILLDPEIGGDPEWDLISRLCHNSPDTVILIHSGSLSFEALFRAIELGGHDLLSKGLPPRQLLRRLKMAVKRQFFLNPAIARHLLKLIQEQDERPPTSHPFEPLELAILQQVANYINITDIAFHLRLTTEQVFGEIDLIIAKVQHAFQTGTRLAHSAKSPPIAAVNFL